MITFLVTALLLIENLRKYTPLPRLFTAKVNMFSPIVTEYSGKNPTYSLRNFLGNLFPAKETEQITKSSTSKIRFDIFLKLLTIYGKNSTELPQCTRINVFL